MSASVDKIVGEAIGRAIIHAKSVIQRSHIRADRGERVGIFVTSLRNQLRDIPPHALLSYNLDKQLFTSLLTNKSVWYDIGELRDKSYSLSHLSNSHLAFNDERMHTWLLIAHRYIESDASIVMSCEKEIVEMKLSLNNAELAAKAAESINQKSGELEDRIRKFLGGS